MSWQSFCDAPPLPGYSSAPLRRFKNAQDLLARADEVIE
jgi:hypothetical protein